MTQNIVIAGADNKVRFTFAGVDLTAATELSVIFGAETYTLTSDPTIVVAESATVLALSLNATAETGRVFVKVKYHDAGTTLGTDITSQVLGNLPQIIVAVGSQLIIEDGSNVSNANSFTTDDEFNSWASLYGYTVPSTEPERDAAQATAFAKLNSYETKISGSRLTIDQAGLFPRSNCAYKELLLESDHIPVSVKVAQMMIAINIGEGATTNAFVAGAVSSSTASGELASFEVPGVIKKSYHASTSTSATGNVLASFPAVDEILLPYTKYGSSGGKMERV